MWAKMSMQTLIPTPRSEPISQHPGTQPGQHGRERASFPISKQHLLCEGKQPRVPQWRTKLNSSLGAEHVNEGNTGTSEERSHVGVKRLMFP